MKPIETNDYEKENTYLNLLKKHMHLLSIICFSSVNLIPCAIIQTDKNTIKCRFEFFVLSLIRMAKYDACWSESFEGSHLDD